MSFLEGDTYFRKTYVEDQGRSSLTVKQEVTGVFIQEMITLMNLRLRTGWQDLAGVQTE